MRLAVLLLLLFPLSAGLSPGSPPASPEARSFGKTAQQQDHAVSSQTNPDIEQVRRLVLQLADPDFGVRQAAHRQLLNMGTACLPVLKEYREAADNELRLSVVRLSERIRDAAHESAIDDFLKHQVDLPGWDRFRELSDDNTASRRLFSQVYREQRAGLLELTDPGADLPGLLDRWLADRAGASDPPARPDRYRRVLISLAVAGIFGALPPEKGAAPSLQIRLGQWLSTAAHRKMLEDPDYGRLCRRAAITWIRAPEANPVVLPAKISAASSLDLPEGLDTAIQCLQMDDIPGLHRRAAISMVARMGRAEHIPVLESLLDDKLVVYRGTGRDPEGRLVTYTGQMGDVALAALVCLTGQEYGDYGFVADRQDDLRRPLPLTLAGFPSGDDREAARQRWIEYRNSNPTERDD